MALRVDYNKRCPRDVAVQLRVSETVFRHTDANSEVLDRRGVTHLQYFPVLHVILFLVNVQERELLGRRVEIRIRIVRPLLEEQWVVLRLANLLDDLRKRLVGKVVYGLLLQTVNKVLLCGRPDEIFYLLKFVRKQVVVRHCYLDLHI